MAVSGGGSPARPGSGFALLCRREAPRLAARCPAGSGSRGTSCGWRFTRFHPLLLLQHALPCSFPPCFLLAAKDTSRSSALQPGLLPAGASACFSVIIKQKSGCLPVTAALTELGSGGSRAPVSPRGSCLVTARCPPWKARVHSSALRCPPLSATHNE